VLGEFVRCDLAGNELGRFSDASLVGLTVLEWLNGELAVLEPTEIRFFAGQSGAFNRSIGFTCPSGTGQGMACDGACLRGSVERRASGWLHRSARRSAPSGQVFRVPTGRPAPALRSESDRA
jgi:hypothetical protein